MADQSYNTTDGNYLRALDDSFIEDAGAVAVPFLGAVGVNLTVDSGYLGATPAITGGECTVPCIGTGTRTLFSVSDGVGLALVKAP